jgi:hypothetical protein
MYSLRKTQKGQVMEDKSKFLGTRKKNNLISIRLNEETEHALKEGMNRKNLTKASYVRLAIIEKNKADSMSE